MKSVQIIQLIVIIIGLAAISIELLPKTPPPQLPAKWEYIEVEAQTADYTQPYPNRTNETYIGLINPDPALEGLEEWEMCASFTRIYTPIIKGTNGASDITTVPKTSTFFVFKRRIQ
jgi:hypothetical protein